MSDDTTIIAPPVIARAPVRALSPAMEANKWKPGQSGNPGGRTAAYNEAMRICREASPEAARKMVALMDSDDPRVAYMATNTVLERAWGKPREYDPRTEQPEPARFDVSKLNPAEREQVRAALMLLATTAAVEEDVENG
jgi:hypothetical protein